MDQKKKRLYLILIVCCILASAIIILWGRGSTPTPVPIPLGDSGSQATAAVTPSSATRGSGLISYPPPPVFPVNTTLDSSVLTSGEFPILQTFNPAQITPDDMGRDDPFKTY